MNGMQSNPTSRYELITTPLPAGTYKFKLNSEDALGNLNTGVEANATLSSLLWHPTGLAVSEVDGNDVTLAWTLPNGGLTADNHVIYGNGGAGYVIDRNAVLATLNATAVETTITVGNGQWFFVIESVKGADETENYYTTFAAVPSSASIPIPPNEIIDVPSDLFDGEYRVQNVSLSNKSVGKCAIEFLWYYGAAASHFRIYHDSKTGTIDWGTYAFRYARQSSIMQKFVTSQITSADDEGSTYKFGIRAESPDGVIEENDIEYEVLLDGTAPDEVTNVTAGDR